MLELLDEFSINYVYLTYYSPSSVCLIFVDKFNSFCHIVFTKPFFLISSLEDPKSKNYILRYLEKKHFAKIAKRTILDMWNGSENNSGV